jgi:hypothetical protein
MLRVKFYDSIDEMPIYNYQQVLDGNNAYMIKNKGIFGNVSNAFENIQRQLVDRFGISEVFKERLDLMQEICILEAEIAITGERFKQLFVNIKKDELKRLDAQTGLSNNELKVIIETWLGFKINTKETSVAEWYGYLQTYSKQQPKKID